MDSSTWWYARTPRRTRIPEPFCESNQSRAIERSQSRSDGLDGFELGQCVYSGDRETAVKQKRAGSLRPFLTSNTRTAKRSLGRHMDQRAGIGVFQQPQR